MKDCIGIIISNSEDKDYASLSKERPDYMLPFGCRYRLIDFALSNMTNHSLSHVMLYSGFNVRSTLDHIGDGKAWDMNRRRSGLFINQPSIDSFHNILSEVRTFYDSITYYENSHQDDIYIHNPMNISKFNLRKSYQEFLDEGLDVMFFYKTIDQNTENYHGLRSLILDEDGKFVNIGLNLSPKKEFKVYNGNLFIKKKVFMDLIKAAIEENSATSLDQCIIQNKESLKIGSYEITSHLEIIYDVYSYYRANMNLLDPKIYEEIFYKDGMVYTKSKDEPSTLYKDGARMYNSLVANGCIIEGQVENSILFRGVHIHKGVIIRNSIISQGTKIHNNAVVVNTITDKFVQIEEGTTIVGADSKPFVISKGETVKGAL